METTPSDCRYTKDHEWIRPEGDRGRVGITHYAQKQLGDVVFVELPDVGRTLKAGERFGTVESVKAVSELFIPIGGKVLEVNAALASAPEALNADPYGAGWMLVLSIADPGSLSGLMDAAAYAAYVASEAK
jgi:glycine cleavage system H protein